MRMTRTSSGTPTTSSSSAPAAPACAPPSRPAMQGKRTAIICKSLFGKAHTVMAEGGSAAAMGNVNPQRQLAGALPRHHARRQVPQQLADGRAARQGGAGPGLGAGDLRRAVRPHQGRQDQPAQLRRPRVPAAGPRRRPHRPGADPHPAAEDRLAAAGGLRARPATTRRRSRSSPSARSPSCCKDGDRIAGAFGYCRETGRFVAVRGARGRPGHRRHRQVATRSPPTPGSTPATGTRWRCAPGATLINMEFVQFHPTGMVWPPSVKGILVTESVRGDGGVLTNSEGKRFMFDYVPDVFREQYAETEEEADRWYTDPDNNRRPPELLPRDEVARAINSEVKAGRGIAARRRLPRHRVPAAGRGDPASGCRRCTTSSRSWPTSTSPRSRWRSARPATT